MTVLKMAASDVPYIPLWWEKSGTTLKSSLVFSELGPWVTYSPWGAHLGLRA